MKIWVQFVLLAALGFGWALPALGQNECGLNATPVRGTNGTDRAGVNHQNICVDDFTGLVFYPNVQSAVFTGNGVLTACKTNSSRFVDQANACGWPGGDLGARIMSAYATCPIAPTGCKVDFECPVNGVIYSTTINFSSPVNFGSAIGTQGNGGCLIEYSGTGNGINVYGVGAFGGATGTILHDFAIVNVGTGKVGIDIDQSPYGVEVRNVTDQPGIAWATSFIRIGNATTGGQMVNAVLNHVYCHGETICYLILRAYGTAINDSVGDQAITQIGDATHIASSTKINGGIFTSTANTTPIQVFNSQVLDVSNINAEIDGTGDEVDCVAGATSCGTINVSGGRINTASQGNQNTWVWGNFLGGTSWHIRDVTVLGLGNATFMFRNQTAPGIATLEHLTTTSGTQTDATAETNVISFGHNFNGTIPATSFFKNSTQYDCIGAGCTAKITLNDPTPRTTILKSPDSVVNGQVGTTTGQAFELISNGNIGARISATVPATLQVLNQLSLGTGGVGTVLISSTVPTIAGAGCGGSAASIVAPNGTGAFKINVGTAPGSACTITMPAATTGWNAHCDDITTQSTSVFVQKQTGAESTNSITITNFNDVAAATAFVANDILKCKAFAD